MAHTPAPWAVTQNSYGTVFVHGGEPMMTSIGGPYKTLIAGGDNYATLKLENATLISAAPDLLEALELFVSEYTEFVLSGDAGFWDPENEEKVKKARAAISKAKVEIK